MHVRESIYQDFFTVLLLFFISVSLFGDICLSFYFLIIILCGIDED